jgi:hypothetical protein
MFLTLHLTDLRLKNLMFPLFRLSQKYLKFRLLE